MNPQVNTSKLFAIIRSLIFLLAAVTVSSMIFQRGPSIPRFQYYIFSQNNLLRIVADYIQLFSLIVLFIHEMRIAAINKKILFCAAVAYAFFILIDINTWVFNFYAHPSFQLILLIQGLPLAVFLCKIFSAGSVNTIIPIISGVILFLSGFFSNYYLFHAHNSEPVFMSLDFNFPTIITITGWLSFIGILLIVSGFAEFLYRKVSDKKIFTSKKKIADY